MFVLHDEMEYRGSMLSEGKKLNGGIANRLTTHFVPKRGDLSNRLEWL